MKFKYYFTPVVLFAFYLLASWVEYGFNPAAWLLVTTATGRFCSVILALLVIAICVMGTAYHAATERRKEVDEKRKDLEKQIIDTMKKSGLFSSANKAHGTENQPSTVRKPE